MTDSLQYPFQNDVPLPGQTIEVAPGIHWLKMPLPFALNHINLWLLRDGDGWCAIDAGYDSDDTRALWGQLFTGVMADRPITRMVATHYHPDHIGLAQWLASRNAAPFHCSYGEFTLAKAVWHDLPGFDVAAFNAHFARHGLPADKARQFTERGNTYHWGVRSLPASFNRILAGDVLTIDGAGWRAIPGFGHSPEHMAFYSETHGVLISGDMLLPKISTNVGAWAADPETDAVSQFLDSLAHFVSLPPDTLVLPSHGKPFRGLHARIDALKAHHADRLAALHAACDTPKTAFELLPVLFGRMFDLYQTMFAMAECITHLNHLWRTGRLQREWDEAGCWRFVQA
jgi:glyoxylase-like metal-dependent hydrolase (beta-lactamase superfamily II)